MPGCFGALTIEGGGLDLGADLSDLKLLPEQRVDGFDLGGLRIASCERAGEPARAARCRESGDFLLLKGEVHGLDEVASASERARAGARLDGHPDAVAVLAAIAAGGRERAVGLPGHYAAILWEPRLARLSIMNDVLGLYPLLFAAAPGALLFGTSTWLFERAGGFRRRLDPRGALDVLRCEHLLDDHTLVEGVRLLAPGSILEVRRGAAPQTRQVVDVFRDRAPEPRALDDAADALGAAYDGAFRRIAAVAEDIVVPLTGGKDSRTVLFELLRADPSTRARLDAFTIGAAEHWDARIARRIARLAGVPWRLAPYDATVPDRWRERFVRLTDGGVGPLVSWWAQVLEHLGRRRAAVATGFLGDTLSGIGLQDYHPNYKVKGAPVAGDPGVACLIDRNDRRNFSREELARTLRPGIAAAFLDGPAHTLWHAYYDVADAPRHTRMIRTETLNRQRRFIGTQLHVYRQRYRALAPFADPDVVRAMLSLTEEQARDQRAYQRAFARRHPAAARVMEASDRKPYCGGRAAHLRCAAEVALLKLGDRLRSRLRGTPWPDREFFNFRFESRTSLLADLEPLEAFFDLDRLRAEVAAQPPTAARLRLLVGLRAWLRAGARASRPAATVHVAGG
jgi:hypothetical protein